jgi:D,D-heptose 1,7-bisphosphate phosphatase
LNYWQLRPGPVGVVFGDIYFDLDLTPLIIWPEGQIYAWKQISHPSSHLFDSDIIESDSSGHILKYHLKPFINLPKVKNRTNAGIYFFNQEAVAWTVSHEGEFPKKFDLDRELIPRMHAEGLQGQAVEDLGYCRDIGTPERLTEVTSHIRSGITSRKVRPMVFLDRDGVINVDTGHISGVGNFIILDGVVEAIRELNSLGVWVVVVTNQPVIARGDLTLAGLNEIHYHLESVLAKEGAFINEIYFCPHHPESGHLGEISDLKIDCICRKPNTGLLAMAVQKYPTDLSRSILVGDSRRDQQAAAKFGIQFIGIKSDSQFNSIKGNVILHLRLLDALNDIKIYTTS